MTELATPPLATQVAYTGLGWTEDSDEHVFLVCPGELEMNGVDPSTRVGWLPAVLSDRGLQQMRICGMTLLSLLRSLELHVNTTAVFRSTEECTVRALMYLEAHMKRAGEVGEPLEFDPDLVFPLGRLCDVDEGLGTNHTPAWLEERFGTSSTEFLLGDVTQDVVARVISVLRGLGPLFPAQQAKLFVARERPLQVIAHYLTTGQYPLDDEALSLGVSPEEPIHLYRGLGESLFKPGPRPLQQQ